MALKSRPLLIFGGSFDPPHSEHLAILKAAVKKIKPFKTIILPSYLSPFKSFHLASYEERKAMARELFLKGKAAKKTTVSDFEKDRGEKTYTWQALEYFRTRYPGASLYLLMGSDSYNSLKKWKKWEYISDKAGLIVAVRKGFKPAHGLPPCIFLKGTFPDISSREARKKIILGDLSAVPPGIGDFIKSKGLYFNRLLKKARAELSPSRYAHTLGVLKLAYELALKLNISPDKAAKAAILHDITKDMPFKNQLKLAGNSKKVKRAAILAPGIIHQWSSAAAAAKEFKIRDKEILSAIASHSSSSLKMSKLAKLIYVCDFAAYGRNFKEAGEIRKAAFKNLETAFRRARKFKSIFLKKEGLTEYYEN